MTPTETAPARPTAYPLFRALKPLASLQLTVVLFALSLGLVFFGTLAQIQSGLWTVVDKYFWSWGVWVPFELFHRFAQVFFLEKGVDYPEWGGSFPFPAGKLIGLLMLVNLLAAHAMRFKLTWRRAGVILIHAGLILLFVGEFITREFAVEQRMTIPKGSTIGYTEDSREYELVFIDRSSPAEDRVVAVPQKVLIAARGGKVTDKALPFDIKLLEYMANSKTETLDKSKRANPATAGVGKGATATAIKEVAGVDTGKMMDFPAVYYQLFPKEYDEPIGTYLGSSYLLRLGMRDDIEFDGKKYEVSFRPRRYYKPFSVQLIEFRFDRYRGTQKAKNFSSEVKLFDADGQLVREQLIRMNEPLRYGGETFYQSSFENEGEATEATILQVVKNPGWLIPYISCVMVGLGLLVHFGTMLTRFLTRENRHTGRVLAAATVVVPGIGEVIQRAAKDTPEERANPQPPNDYPAFEPRGWWQKNLPWVALSILTLYLGSVYSRMKPKDAVDLDAFCRLPVLDGGRVKPLDSTARVYLRIVSGKSAFDDPQGKERPAIRWYLDTLAADFDDKKHPAWDYKVVRIDNEQVLAELKLKVREGLRYSINELRPHFGTIDKKRQDAASKSMAKKKLDQTDEKYLELAKRISLVRHVAHGRGHDTDANTFNLLPPLEGEKWASLGEVREEVDNAEFGAALLGSREALRSRPGFNKEAEIDFVIQLLRGNVHAPPTPDMVKNFHKVLFESSAKDIPPSREFRDQIEESLSSGLNADEKAAVQARKVAAKAAAQSANPVAAEWEAMLTAYRAGDAAEFNRLLGEYAGSRFAVVGEKEARNVKLELSYNRFSPFLHCVGLYVFALVLGLVGYFMRGAEKPGWAEGFRRAAVLVLLGTLLVHTIALLVRMAVMDRWFVFVTNLYSSAVFIGWGCVGIGLVLERLYPIGIGNAIAAVLGLSTSIVAHNLATEDTLEMMQAVLDTNFWLATHVTTVTLGYTATFVAGFLGAVYVFQVLATVIRDGFHKPEPTVGALLAFGVAAGGLIAIPVLISWPVVNALAKFELVHSIIPNTLPYVFGIGGAIYAIMLQTARAQLDGSQSGSGQVPAFARPVTRMALTPEGSKVQAQMIYGVLCFATMLSFIGTVLGGIWADQSWGRFWGWDPKENGAVLIVLWNALILHARWCGLVKARGVAVLAVAGNMVTAWSWFGTNQLEIGLHAYGFDNRLADGCANFWAGMMVIVLLGLIPQRFWASATGRPAKGTTPVAKDGANGHAANGHPTKLPWEKKGKKRK